MNKINLKKQDNCGKSKNGGYESKGGGYGNQYGGKDDDAYGTPQVNLAAAGWYDYNTTEKTIRLRITPKVRPLSTAMRV